jgi:large subunit ribosomal protein L25
MNAITVTAVDRTDLGKTGVKRTRAEGFIPAVIYGNADPKPISVSKSEVRHLIYTPNFHLAEVNINGGVEKCIVKDYQTHPVTEEILHMDFLRLKEGVAVKVDIPVKFKGVSPGEKVGGKLSQQMRKVTIKTTPENLIDSVTVDISHLELGDVLRVRDIVVDDSIEIMVGEANPLATVETPRALKSADAAAEKEGAESEEGDTEEATAE